MQSTVGVLSVQYMVCSSHRPKGKPNVSSDSEQGKELNLYM